MISSPRTYIAGHVLPFRLAIGVQGKYFSVEPFKVLLKVDRVFAGEIDGLCGIDPPLWLHCVSEECRRAGKEIFVNLEDSTAYKNWNDFARVPELVKF